MVKSMISIVKGSLPSWLVGLSLSYGYRLNPPAATLQLHALGQDAYLC